MFSCNRVIINDKNSHLAGMYVQFFFDRILAFGIIECYGNNKCRAFALLTLDTDRAVHHLDDILGYRKTKT